MPTGRTMLVGTIRAMLPTADARAAPHVLRLHLEHQEDALAGTAYAARGTGATRIPLHDQFWLSHAIRLVRVGA